jgi:hypothetical protein
VVDAEFLSASGVDFLGVMTDREDFEQQNIEPALRTMVTVGVGSIDGPVAVEIAFGQLRNGGQIFLTLNNEDRNQKGPSRALKGRPS